MKTDSTLAFIGSMVSSDSSYSVLMDMISEMDLEIMEVSLS